MATCSPGWRVGGKGWVRPGRAGRKSVAAEKDRARVLTGAAGLSRDARTPDGTGELYYEDLGDPTGHACCSSGPRREMPMRPEAGFAQQLVGPDTASPTSTTATPGVSAKRHGYAPGLGLSPDRIGRYLLGRGPARSLHPDRHVNRGVVAMLDHTQMPAGTWLGASLGAA